MDGAGEDFEWPPAGAHGGGGRGVDSRRGNARRGSGPRGGRGAAGAPRTGDRGLRGPRGPRWVVSLRALVVVLAMLAAALGLLWLEAAGVEGVSAELANQKMGKVQVPPLTTGPPALGPTGARPPGTPALPGPDLPDTTSPNTASSGITLPGITLPGGAVPDTAVPRSGNALVVHVTGAVTHPGVVRVEPGCRVFQAIDAAGGALATAQLSALNLAAQVEDGQQILVPTVEEAATWQPGAGAGSQQGPAAGSGASPGSGGAQQVVNINTATAAELQALPGVGPVLAERIVGWRNEHGAYPSVDALDAVSGIGPKMLARIRDLVRVS